MALSTLYFLCRAPSAASFALLCSSRRAKGQLLRHGDVRCPRLFDSVQSLVPPTNRVLGGDSATQKPCAAHTSHRSTMSDSATRLQRSTRQPQRVGTQVSGGRDEAKIRLPIGNGCRLPARWDAPSAISRLAVHLVKRFRRPCTLDSAPATPSGHVGVCARARVDLRARVLTHPATLPARLFAAQAAATDAAPATGGYDHAATVAAHVQVTPARARSAAAAHVLRCSSRTTPPPCLPAALPLCQAPGQLPAHFGLGAPASPATLPVWRCRCNTWAQALSFHAGHAAGHTHTVQRSGLQPLPALTTPAEQLGGRVHVSYQGALGPPTGAATHRTTELGPGAGAEPGAGPGTVVAAAARGDPPAVASAPYSRLPMYGMMSLGAAGGALLRQVLSDSAAGGELPAPRRRSARTTSGCLLATMPGPPGAHAPAGTARGSS